MLQAMSAFGFPESICTAWGGFLSPSCPAICYCPGKRRPQDILFDCVAITIAFGCGYP
jgi:hypothetical protein